MSVIHAPRLCLILDRFSDHLLKKVLAISLALPLLVHEYLDPCLLAIYLLLVTWYCLSLYLVRLYRQALLHCLLTKTSPWY